MSEENDQRSSSTPDDPSARRTAEPTDPPVSSPSPPPPPAAAQPPVTATERVSGRERLRRVAGNRFVPIVAAGLIGGIIGGGVVGVIGAVFGDDHHGRGGEHSRYQKHMRGGDPYWRFRGGDGGAFHGGPGNPRGYQGHNRIPAPEATPAQPAVPASPEPTVTPS